MTKGKQNKKLIAFVSNSCWSLLNYRLDIMQHCLNDGFKVLAIAQKDKHYAKLIAAFPHTHFIFRDVEFCNTSLNPLHDLKTLRKLYSIYKEESPDIIFHYVTKPVIYGSWIAGKLNIPSIGMITGLGYVYETDSWLRKLVDFLFQQALSNINQLWFLNQENADLFVQKKVVAATQIQVIPGEGINTKLFTPVSRSVNPVFVFIVVSRLLWSKGIGIYVEAARQLNQRGLNARFQCLGISDPAHPDAISLDQMEQWQKEGIVEWLGASDEVASYLQKADCLVAPTYYEEGVPKSIMEAFSMELPVIGTHHIGCDVLIDDGVNGLLCKVKDPLDLSYKMEEMMHLTALERKQMGENGRKKMRTYFDTELIYSYYKEAIEALTS